MSFNLEFVAKTKDIAIARVDKAIVPQSIKDFIKAAIEALPEDKLPLDALGNKAERVVAVKTWGHLCDGPSSARKSNTMVDVDWITISLEN